MDHFAGLPGMEPAGGKAVDDEREAVEDGVPVLHGVKAALAEGRDCDGGRASAALPLVVVAEGAGAEGGRLAAEAVGSGVAAEREDGVFGLHCCLLAHGWAEPMDGPS